MKPYVKTWTRDATHPDGKPTPKAKRARAAKKAVRACGKTECRGAD